MMRTWIIVTGFLFVLGNMFWPRFHEPKVMYVPLALFLFLLLHFVASKTAVHNRVQFYLLNFLSVLAVGNIVKQVTYKAGTQTWDYVWGATAAVIYIIFLFIKDKKWANRLIQQGKTGN